MRRSRFRNRRGFTLIEVLVALALGLLLSIAVLSFFRDLVLHRSMIAERVDQERAAQALIDNLSRELTCAIVGVDRFGPGLIGDEQRIVILGRSVAVDQVIPGRGRLGDLTELEFQFDPSVTSLRGGRRLVQADGETSGSDDLKIISSELGWVRFRYLDQGLWRSTYNSAQRQSLPAAVEVAIWYVTPRAMQEMEFDSTDGVVDEPLIEEAAPDRLRIISIPDAVAISTVGDFGSE